MAHYDAHGMRNRGYDGYGKREPAYGAAVVGYSAVSESYVASTEQVVKLSGYPYSNRATHGQVWPLSSSQAQFKKEDDYDYDYSPKFSHATSSPPRKTSYRANSPPQGHYFDMHDTSPLNSPRENFHGQVQPLNSTHVRPKKDDYDNFPKLTIITNSPRDSTSYAANSPPQGHYSDMYNTSHKSSPKKDDDYGYSPKSSLVTKSPHDSPRKPFFRAASPPPPGRYSGMFDTNLNSSHDSPRNNIRGNRGNFSSAVDDDDAKCRDGVCYPKSKHVQGYSRENPRKDSANNDEMATLSYPASHEINRNYPRGTAPWAPPRTRHPEVIDSAEKQRRHGTTAPPPQADRKHKKTNYIDSDTLAKMYGGVYVK